jgi:signal recognition particle subunit SRP19
VPKGWKMASILPYYSPGLTGGGVSENFLKDMMAEMGGGGMPGMIPGVPGMSGGEASGSGVEVKKKEKKEKKKK